LAQWSHRAITVRERRERQTERLVTLYCRHSYCFTDYRLPFTDHSQDADEKRVWR